jgi:hypothetical protein
MAQMLAKAICLLALPCISAFTAPAVRPSFAARSVFQQQSCRTAATAPLSGLASVRIQKPCPATRLPWLSSQGRGATQLRSSQAAEGEEVTGAAEASPKLIEGLGKGLKSDLKGKSRYFGSDIKDGLNIKVSTYKAAHFQAWFVTARVCAT